MVRFISLCFIALLLSIAPVMAANVIVGKYDADLQQLRLRCEGLTNSVQIFSMWQTLASVKVADPDQRAAAQLAVIRRNATLITAIPTLRHTLPAVINDLPTLTAEIVKEQDLLKGLATTNFTPADFDYLRTCKDRLKELKSKCDELDAKCKSLDEVCNDRETKIDDLYADLATVAEELHGNYPDLNDLPAEDPHNDKLFAVLGKYLPRARAALDRRQNCHHLSGELALAPLTWAQSAARHLRDIEGVTLSGTVLQEIVDAELPDIPEHVCDLKGSLDPETVKKWQTEIEKIPVATPPTPAQMHEQEIGNDLLRLYSMLMLFKGTYIKQVGFEKCLQELDANDNQITAHMKTLTVYFTHLDTDVREKVNLTVDAIANPSATAGADYQRLYAELQPAFRQWQYIDRDWQGVKAILSRQRKLGDGTQRIPFEELDGLSAAIVGRMTVLGRAVEVLDETLAGHIDRFAFDQVRLYYNIDVRRIITMLLRQPPQELDPNAAAVRSSADALRETMLAQQRQVFDTLQKLNNLQMRRLTIAEQIRQARAEEKNAGKQLDAAKFQEAYLNKKVEQLTAKPDAELKSTQEEAAAQTRLVKEAEKVKSDAESSHQAMLNEETGLPGRQREMEAQFNTQLATLHELRGKVDALAAKEAVAAGEAIRNAPIWYHAARAYSEDPIRRVFLFAYDDGKTIYLWGLPRDVQRVKAIIASLDRPAPQARITLWTLQVNGQQGKENTAQLNKALQDIDTALNELRGDMTMVQDVLRNSINEEVNRMGRITDDAMGFRDYHDDVISDRMERFFYYPNELREALGFPFTLPDLPESAAVLRCELTSAREAYARAKSMHEQLRMIPNTWDAKVREARELLMARRTLYLNIATYHMEQAVNAAQTFAGEAGRYHGAAFTSAYYLPPGSFPSTFLPGGLLLADRIDQFLQIWFQQELEAQKLLMAGDDTLFDQYFSLNSTTRLKSKPDILQSNLLLSRNLNAAIDYMGELLPLCRDEVYARATTEPYFRFPTPRERDDVNYLTQWTLPDPALANTLGEMLFVWNLGKRDCRERILFNFLRELYDTTLPIIVHARQPQRWYGGTKASDADADGTALLNFLETLHAQFGKTLGFHLDLPMSGPQSLYPYFPRTVLGTNMNRTPGELTSWGASTNQKEIFHALNVKAREAVAAQVCADIREIDLMQQRGIFDVRAANEVRERYLPLVGWLAWDGASAQTMQPGADCWYRLGLRACNPSVIPAPTDLNGVADLYGMDRLAWHIAQREGGAEKLSTTTPRVAAADEMIKRFITVLEDDMDYFFISPTLKRIRRVNSSPSIQLGTIQRESVLATNRLIARVDPNASGDIQLSGATDLVDSALQLATLAKQYQQSKGAYGKNFADDVLPVLGAAGIAQMGNISDFKSGSLGLAALTLGSFAALPRDTGEIYTINSGDLFKVSPVFDPSGQALRFKFDYAATVRVREPDGTVNRLIPRVERHTVNTEVQLSNMEVREISRFESNTQLGMPEQRLGGIPLIRDLAPDLPLVGYFVKRPEKKGMQQVSLILAQTSMYPTVADIINLMVASRAPEYIDNELPEYLRTYEPAAP